MKPADLQTSPTPEQTARYRGKPYVMTDKGLLWWKPMVGGRYLPQLIANFCAEILRDVVLDDGQETLRAYQIQAIFEKQVKVFVIPARDFGAMNWPGEQLGGRAIVFPNCRDHVATAIRSLTKRTDPQNLYRHVGWRQVEGKHIYCHAGGGISAKGLCKVETQLQSPLQHYLLPDPRKRAEIKRAVKASMRFLDLAPDRITFPLYSSIWRAIMGGADFSLHVAGLTGTCKSQLAGLAQAHFGAAMRANKLPASWTGTANALEALAFEAKDALLVIDDFIPTGNASDIARLNATADRIMRGQGNQGGRIRMGAELNLRAAKFSRGIILSTGEDTPGGQSLRARLVIIELSPGDVDVRTSKGKQFLTERQADARIGLYAMAAAGFIRWLAPQVGGIERQLQQDLDEFRKGWTGLAPHARTPDNLCSLGAGFRKWLAYARHMGAVNAADADKLWLRARQAFQDLIEHQQQDQLTTDPTKQFVALLASALSSGQAHVISDAGGAPPQPAKWGWIAEGKQWKPGGQKIGWLRGDDLFLDSNLSFSAVQKLGAETGQRITLTLPTLKRRLKQAGLLSSVDETRQTIDVRVTLEGARRDVLHFSQGGVYATKPDQPAQPQTVSVLTQREWSEKLEKPDQPAQEPTAPNIRQKAVSDRLGRLVRFPRTPPPQAGNAKKAKKALVRFALSSPSIGQVKPDQIVKNVLNKYAETVSVLRSQYDVGAGFVAALVTKCKAVYPEVTDAEIAVATQKAWKRDQAKQTSAGLFLTTVPALFYEWRKKNPPMVVAKAAAVKCTRCRDFGFVFAEVAPDSWSLSELGEMIRTGAATFCKCAAARQAKELVEG